MLQSVYSVFPLINIDQIFQKSWFLTLQVKGFQIYRPSKFAATGIRTRVGRRPHFFNWRDLNAGMHRHRFSFFFDRELWGTTVLQPLDIQGYILLYLKVLTYICLEPEAQGRLRTIKVLYLALKRPYFT